MAKPLNERLSKALTSDAARVADIRAVIAEAEKERERLSGVMAQATADSLNLGLSDEDRDDAASDADRARRDVVALGTAIEALSQKLAAREAMEEEHAVKARRVSLLADRDRIADRMATEWPAIEAAIVELLGAVTANEADMRAAGIYEANAEAVARDLPGNFARGPIQFRQLTKMAVPSFRNGNELAWPAPAKSSSHWTEVAERTRRNQIAAQRRAEQAEDAAWALYSVSAGTVGSVTEVVGRVSKHGPEAIVTLFPAILGDSGGRFDNSPRQIWLHANKVSWLRKLGVVVEAVS